MLIFSRIHVMERATWKPNVEICPACPRCGSMNTKFCYYNNYSLTQPRYFCKGCRRYWTKGGSLRNVPVGGGCRKTRRGKSIRVSTNNNILSGTTSNKDRPMFSGHLPESSTSNGPASPATGPNIDLAAVYANFMNQKPPPPPPPQPGHIPAESLPNNGGGGGPPFEFSNFPTMLNVDYFGHQESGFVDEYGNQGGVFFQEQFGINNNNNDDYQMSNCLLQPPILSNNSDMNMMFPLQTSAHESSAAVMEPQLQGCPNLHTNATTSNLFGIPNYEWP